ncbi:hypothetical protein D3C75_1048910 [compost metagenome]
MRAALVAGGQNDSIVTVGLMLVGGQVAQGEFDAVAGGDNRFHLATAQHVVAHLMRNLLAVEDAVDALDQVEVDH